MSGFRFESPWFLLALALIVVHRALSHRRLPPAVVISSSRLLAPLGTNWILRLGKLLSPMRYVGWACLIAALARPQYGEEERRVQSEGIAIMMCIDKSGSMRAMDFEIEGRRVNRLDAVKRIFRDFVLGSDGKEGRRDDQIGLVAFGGFAECVCPLTLDHATLIRLLDAIRIPEPSREYPGHGNLQRVLNLELETAIGDALVLACDRLKEAKAKSRVIILLSDGDNNAGATTPEEAAVIAQKLGIRVHCIGVGSVRGTRMPMQDAFGRLAFSSQVVRLDDRALRAIAATTNGKYWNAEDSRALVEVYSEIDKLEKTAHADRVFVRFRELFIWPLGIGLALCGIAWFAQMTRWRTLP